MLASIGDVTCKQDYREQFKSLLVSTLLSSISDRPHTVGYICVGRVRSHLSTTEGSSKLISHSDYCRLQTTPASQRFALCSAVVNCILYIALSISSWCARCYVQIDLLSCS